MSRKILCFFIVLCLAAEILSPFSVQAAKLDLVKLTVSLDGGPVTELAAYESNYANNYYVSLRGLAILLSGTTSQFRFYNDAEGAYHVDLGYPYDPSLEPKKTPGTEGTQNDDGTAADNEAAAESAANAAADDKKDLTPAEITYIEFSSYWLKKDEQSVIYYTYADYTIEDLYMSLIDVQMLLDINIVYENGIYNIITDKHFKMNLNKLKEQGYFDYLHGVVLGDATTGEIFMGCNQDRPAPIASTSKLMTCLIVERMIELGRIGLDDQVTISDNVSRLSYADDGVIGMYPGEVTTVEELMYAMLVASSNESALALAEYVAGSQDEFVRMMNAMAAKLGMDTAVFYNPHGLPEYLKGDAVIMVENQASPSDMFKLARALMLKYPQITKYTSTQEIWLDYLWVNLYSTNNLMYNMPDVYGLKTGTTDAAGKCLVSARTVNVNGEDHIIIAVVLGAEFDSDRVQVSELLQRGAAYYLYPEATVEVGALPGADAGT